MASASINLYSLLQAQAEAHPLAAALIDCTRRAAVTLDFAAFDDAVARAAAFLVRHGLQAGDPVLLFHPMSADLYIALGAIFRLGLVGAFIDPSLGREHLARCCALTSPRALLATPKAHLLRLVAPALRVLFCGINPGLYTAAIGHHFGRPGNRFWPALHGAGFTPRQFAPWEEQQLLPLGLGITNMGERTTAAAAELSTEEAVVGGKRLGRIAGHFQPLLF